LQTAKILSIDWEGFQSIRRPEFVGGGLVRSMGGWPAVKAMHRSGER
jgi:hypothetical protein